MLVFGGVIIKSFVQVVRVGKHTSHHGCYGALGKDLQEVQYKQKSSGVISRIIHILSQSQPGHLNMSRFTSLLSMLQGGAHFFDKPSEPCY